MDVPFIRTALFVPGNQPERVDKAVRTAADALIIDLEDAVPLAEKANARIKARDKLIQHPNRLIFVRVNSFESGFLQEDLDCVAAVNSLDGIILPKVEGKDHIRKIDDILNDLEHSQGLARGSVILIPLIESARAIECLFEIASEKVNASRLYTVAFGAADFARDLGIELTKEGGELSYARSRIPIACRAAGLDPPLDTPFMLDLKDLKALEADAKRAKQAGFQGKLCVHPSQIEPVNEVFSPSDEEISFAKLVVQAFDEAKSKGKGAIQVKNKMIDYPVAEHFRKILKMASFLGKI